jgi:hypothetical protein
VCAKNLDSAILMMKTVENRSGCDGADTFNHSMDGSRSATFSASSWHFDLNGDARIDCPFRKFHPVGIKTQNRMILCEMSDLCRAIFGQHGKPRSLFCGSRSSSCDAAGLIGCLFYPPTGWFSVGPASYFRRPVGNLPSFGLIPWFVASCRLPALLALEVEISLGPPWGAG